jgi:hypothetical protein
MMGLVRYGIRRIRKRESILQSALKGTQRVVIGRDGFNAVIGEELDGLSKVAGLGFPGQDSLK